MTPPRIPSRFPATLFDRAWAARLPHPVGQHCVLKLSGQIDAVRLARAVRLAFDADPILGCRFVERWFRPYWQRLENLDCFCEVRNSSHIDTDLQTFFEANPDSCVRVVVLRGQRDVLCIKFDHLVGDGKALHEYAYLLADIYNQLGSNPHYRPAAVTDGSRDFTNINQRFTLRERWQIVRHILSARERYKTLGQWRFPADLSDAADLAYLSWTLDPGRAKAIFDYGYRRRATVSHVLLAAFYLAAREVIPHSPDKPLPATLSVDLRRFVPSVRTASANFVGNAAVSIDVGASSLDMVVEQIQQQMIRQRKYLGLAASFFAFEALPGVRQLVGLVPFGLAKRRWHKEKELERARGHVDGVILLSNGGELDANRLAFQGVDLVDAYATAGVFRIPGLLGLGVGGFRGSLNLYLGCGPTSTLKHVSERMMQILDV